MYSQSTLHNTVQELNQVRSVHKFFNLKLALHFYVNFAGALDNFLSGKELVNIEHLLHPK